MPNYKRQVQKPTRRPKVGIARMFFNSSQKLVVEYASGYREILDTVTGLYGSIVYDGEAANSTLTKDQDGGTAVGAGKTSIDGGSSRG